MTSAQRNEAQETVACLDVPEEVIAEAQGLLELLWSMLPERVGVYVGWCEKTITLSYKDRGVPVTMMVGGVL